MKHLTLRRLPAINAATGPLLIPVGPSIFCNLVTVKFELAPTPIAEKVVNGPIFAVSDVTDWAFSCPQLACLNLYNLTDDTIIGSRSLLPIPATLAVIHIQGYALTDRANQVFWASLRGHLEALCVAVAKIDQDATSASDIPYSLSALSRAYLTARRLWLRVNNNCSYDVPPGIRHVMRVWSTDYLPRKKINCGNLKTLLVYWTGDPHLLQTLLRMLRKNKMPALKLLHLPLIGNFDPEEPTMMDLIAEITHLSDQGGFMLWVDPGTCGENGYA